MEKLKISPQMDCEDIMIRTGFIWLGEHRFELTDKANIGWAKNILHEKGYFLRLTRSNKAFVEDKQRLTDEEFDSLKLWAKLKRYELDKNAQTLSFGNKKIYLYALKASNDAGRVERQIFGEYANRQENISKLLKLFEFIKSLPMVSNKSAAIKLLSIKKFCSVIEIEY